MSHVERTSKYTKLAKLPDKNADSVVQACARVLLPLADQIETITYDNGKEFASHAQIATSLGALSYFAKPYHSWERGLNEHTNGLFRQYFPKGSDFSIFSDADVQIVADKLNYRPRKILGYQTPRVFSSEPEICPSDFTVEWPVGSWWRNQRDTYRERLICKSGCSGYRSCFRDGSGDGQGLRRGGSCSRVGRCSGGCGSPCSTRTGVGRSQGDSRPLQCR